jgi:nicotinate dehydrogenase subunit A
MATIKLTVNGRIEHVDTEPETPLLYVLRDDLQLNGAKYGCGLGQCGACTVVIDAEAVLSCVTPVLLVQDRKVTTLEGLGTLDKLGALQQAFIDEQAAQCGYCIPGMIMAAHALLGRNANPTDEQIRSALRTNLCRCGTHVRILAAIRRAAARLRESGAAQSSKKAT